MTTTDRARQGLAVALPTVALLLPAPAAAANGPLPEVDSGPPATEFADDPTIAAPHPLVVQSFSRTADPRTIELHFTSGVPQCYGVHATWTETPDALEVTVRGGLVATALHRVCPMVVLPGSVRVTLADDLGERPVVAS